MGVLWLSSVGSGVDSKDGGYVRESIMIPISSQHDFPGSRFPV